MAITFASAIGVGTLLLMLPAAQTSGRFGNPLTALFLATSATCVTGLSPVDIAVHLTFFGQLTMLALMQLGGLGIMTLGTFLFEVMGRRMSMSDEQVVMRSLAFSTSGKVRSLLWRTVVFTGFWEALGAVLLGLRLYHAYGYSAPRAAYHGVFHSISAFCNAGFSLYPDSLVRFSDDPVMLLLFSVLIIAGGLGFVVVHNLGALAPWRRDRFKRGHLLLHTRIVLYGTAVLLVLGTLLVVALEWRSGLAHLLPRDRWIGALFQSVTCRTAGFSAVETASLSGGSKTLSMVLMFIGGAPGSTAGGIKISTAVVLVATVMGMIRNREETEFARRTVPIATVRESIVISVLALAMVGLCATVLHLTEAANRALVPASGLSLTLLFETVSAFGTVGLSLGATQWISGPGLGLLVVCMFVGRLGPLTLAITMSGAGQGPARRYPEENVVVG